MPALLLETKLYVPGPRRGLVPRPRLSQRLDRGTTSKLMLISAPAGFGKTTLLTEWLAAGRPGRPTERQAAWLSLDRADNDPASFWTYVIAALQTVAPGVGESALALLQAPQPPPIETVLTALLNDLGGRRRDIVLVLDDYHVIDTRDVQDAMAFLLDHLPPRLHVVIASRTDPALPLARLRARGELVETRAAELRFTPDEAAAYLNEMMGLRADGAGRGCAGGTHRGLDRRAPAGGAVDAGARRRRPDFIAGFAGDDRYVVDYLADEVLHRQSGSGSRPSCCRPPFSTGCSGSAVRRRHREGGGKAMLEALERGNLFLVPLDDRRRWYRYHHLFADVLRARLLDEQPDQVPDLHQRASAGTSRAGEPAVAIGHALAAGDFERAADLAELAIPAMSRTPRGSHGARVGRADPRRGGTASGRCSASASPGALLSGGELEGVDRRLRDAEALARRDNRHRCETEARSAEMVVADEGEYRRLPGDDRAVPRRPGPGPGRPRRHGQARPAGARSLRSRTTISAGPAASAILGLAFWTSGISEAGHAAYAECMAGLRRAGHIADIFGCAIALADIRACPRSPRRGERTYEQALAACSRAGRPGSAGNGRHVRRDERGPPRAQRLAYCHGAAAAGARSWASTPGCRRTGIAGGLRWLGLRQAEGRSGRRTRPARRGRAGLRRRLLPQCSAGPGAAGQGTDSSQGRLGDGARLGA